MTRAVAVGIATTLALGAASVAHGDPRVRLEVDGDACDPSTVRPKVAELLGHDGFVPATDDADVDLVVRYSIARDDHGLRATIELDESGAALGKRSFEAADCAALTDAAALAIAMVLAEPRAAAPSAGATSPDPPSPTPVAPITDAETPPPPAIGLVFAPPQQLAGFETSAGVAGGRASGDFQGQVVIGAALHRGRRSVALEFGLAAPDRVAIGMGRVVATTYAFDVVGCLHRGPLAGCATTAVGWVQGRGEGLINSSTARSLYVAPGLRAAWTAGLSDRIAVRVELSARAPVTRNRFLVDQMPVWSTSPVEGWLGLSLVARIP